MRNSPWAIVPENSTYDWSYFRGWLPAQEKLLKQFVHEQQEKLTAVGHELSEWQAKEDLKMEAQCTRCKGIVTVGVGEMNLIGYFPLMNTERCLADDPVQMEAANKEVQAVLGRVYALLLSKARDK